MKPATITIRRPKSRGSNAGAGDREHKIFKPYMKSVLNTRVVLTISEVGKYIKQNLETKIASSIAGKCISEGFIKPDSIKIIRYSSGNIMSDVVQFQVVFECMICMPVEGMLVECTCKTVTKAGIHAEVIDTDGTMPLAVFIARDHHHMDERLNKIKEGDSITASIIGVRYELNDPYICSIAKLTNIGMDHDGKKPRLNLGVGKKELDHKDQNITVEIDELSDDGEF